MAEPSASLLPMSAAIAKFKAVSVALAAELVKLAYLVHICTFDLVFPAVEP